MLYWGAKKNIFYCVIVMFYWDCMFMVKCSAEQVTDLEQSPCSFLTFYLKNARAVADLLL